MKEVDQEQAPDVSGGYRPNPGNGPGGCLGPYGPLPIDYPQLPGTPVPDKPWSDPIA